MNNIIQKIIWTIHFSIILCVICIPFIQSPYFLLLHTIFVPFLILHWVTNNNTCVLTTAEKYFRNVKTKEDEEDCYTCKLIYPMFDFKKNNIDSSTFIYVATISLWLISFLRLILKYKSGEISKLSDFFIIKKPL